MSRSLRGEYRAIHTVLIDGPDFQALSAEARLVFLVAKLSCGPTGIEVLPAPLPTLEVRSGLTSGRLKSALGELQAADWLRLEGNVVWIVRGLEFEPSLKLLNARHLAGVRAHVAGLPRLPIVADFRARYPQWFEASERHTKGFPEACEGHGIATPMAIDSPSIAMPMAIEGLSILPKTEDGRRKTENGKRHFVDFEEAFGKAWACYPRRPGNSRGKALKAWSARIRDGEEAEVMLAGVRAYAAYVARQQVEPRFIKHAATFFGPDKPYLDDYGDPDPGPVRMYSEGGEMSPEAARILLGDGR